MTNPKSRIVAAVAGALSVGATAAWADQATSTDVKIQQLEAKVAQLEAQQAQSSKDVAATIDSVLRDAEHRSQLMAMGGDASAGYDNGFFIRAGDAWTLRPCVLFQFWNNTDFRSKAGPSSKDQTDNGFEVHRMEFILEGTAVSKDLTYRFDWNVEPDSGTVFLEDAWAKWMFTDQFGVRMGQFRDLLTHEWLSNDGRQLAAERSMLDWTLGGGFVGWTQGASIVYGGYDKNNPLNAELAFTDGLNQIDTNWVSKTGTATIAGPHAFDFGITGRVEYKVMGDWKDYADASAMGTKSDLLVVGGGFDWSQSGDGNAVTGAVDAQWELAMGLGLYGGFIYRHADDKLTGLANDANDYGLVIQAGYLLAQQWEIFGRYDWVHLDNKLPTAGDERNFHEFTVGLNYFLGNNGAAGHRAKFTVDLGYYPNGVPAGLFDTTRIGALGDNAGNDEWLLRGQFQLML